VEQDKNGSKDTDLAGVKLLRRYLYVGLLIHQANESIGKSAFGNH